MKLFKELKLFYTYLAGPIELDTSDGGQSWRNSMTPILDDAGIAVQDPCKTEPLATGMDVITAQDQFNRWIKGGRTDLFMDDFEIIIDKDIRMVKRSDFIIAHLFPNIGTTGTIHEMVVAYQLKKPIYLVYYGAVSSLSKWALALTLLSGGKVFPNKKQLTDYVTEHYATKNQHWHTMVIQGVRSVIRLIENNLYEKSLKRRKILNETPEETLLREKAEEEAVAELQNRSGQWPMGESPAGTTKKEASDKTDDKKDK
jgi:nucleoside 2-deoxyribosyltransferase